MDAQMLAIIVAAVIGAIGGALYLIVPPNEVRTLKNWTDKLMLASTRVFVGAVVGVLFSPVLWIVVEGGWRLNWALIAALIALLSAGYFGMEIIKTVLQKPNTVPGIGRG